MVLEFAENFEENFVELRGHPIPITVEIIIIVFGFPIEDDELIAREQYDVLIDRFHQTGE